MTYLRLPEQIHVTPTPIKDNPKLPAGTFRAVPHEVHGTPIPPEGMVVKSSGYYERRIHAGDLTWKEVGEAKPKAKPAAAA